MKVLDSVLMTQRHVTLKYTSWYVTLESFISHVCRTLS